MLGTKMMLLSQIGLNEYWIFFIEHVAIWMTCLVLYFIYISYQKCISKTDENKIEFNIIKDYRKLLCAFIGGTCNATGNVFIIFAMRHAIKSGANPSTISSVLMLNAILMLIIGITVFKEKHRFMKYL